MTYFVTGATGLIGRHLVQRVLTRAPSRPGADIYVLVRPESMIGCKRSRRNGVPPAPPRRRPG